MINSAATDPGRAHLARILDGFAYAAVALAVILLHPGLALDVLGHVRPVIYLPPLLFLRQAFLLAPAHPENRTWAIRLCALPLLGTLPLAAAWLNAPTSQYYYGNAMIGLLAFTLLLFNLVALSSATFQQAGAKQLAAFSRFVAILGLAIPVAPPLTVIFQVWRRKVETSEGLPAWETYAMLYPVRDVMILAIGIQLILSAILLTLAADALTPKGDPADAGSTHPGR